MTLQAEIDAQIQEVLPATTEFRHELHKHPELTWQEEQTAKTIAEALGQIPGLKITTGIGRFGIIADLEGDAAGPMLALRADMDALPVTEKTKGNCERTPADSYCKNPGETRLPQ